MYNLLIGGAAGQGVDTAAAILEKLLKKSGYNVFATSDFMSRIRGGHNFILLRFGTEVLMSHSDVLDGIIALNDETVEVHKDKLQPGGFIIGDSNLLTDDPRAVKIKMSDTAKELGNSRVASSVALGAVLKLFGENLDLVSSVLETFFKQQIVDINVKAFAAGYELVDNRFPRLHGKFSDWMTLSGSKAMSLGAVAAGLRFYSAYPMSPSTSLMENLAEFCKKTAIVVEQAEDEIAAINMAIGASFAGARAMTATSGGGFSLMVEALGLSGIAEIPLVAANFQRPGPATGLPTRTEQSDLKFVISASQGEFPRIVIALRNHTDSFYQTIRAFNLAEKYQIPVIILTDQYLADATATVEPYDLTCIENEKPAQEKTGEGEYLRYKLTDDGISPRLIPGKSKNFVLIDSDEHDERGWITESAEMRVKMVDKRMSKLEKLQLELQEPEYVGADDCEILLVGWGSTYGPIAEAITRLNAENATYGALIFGDIFPLPKKLLTEKSAKAKQIVNVEQNATGQLADLIREQTGIACTSSILKYDGRQISADEVVNRLLKEGQK
ncbi:MAG TPA: 2-oxoacid:acceptor oxidoreductase subunit alpha [Clostridia bacterium]|nr:2-oxoacid:acceptor oxidoreductase subunit alpha [Clostridia bacterium]